MDCAPLNLAHFHERRADKLIKRHRYEEASKAIETSLLYVEDAYKHVRIPKALEVLKTQKWDYERKLNQIHMRKLQYDKLKSKEIVPSAQNDVNYCNIKKDPINAQTIARSIDKTIKDFNDKYQRNCGVGKYNSDKETQIKGTPEELHIDNLETNIRRLSLKDEQMQPIDAELPSLAPLELPSFDYTVFNT